MSRWGKEVCRRQAEDRWGERRGSTIRNWFPTITDWYMSKGLHRKKKTRVWADPKSLSYSTGNVFIYKQLEDKPQIHCQAKWFMHLFCLFTSVLIKQIGPTSLTSKRTKVSGFCVHVQKLLSPWTPQQPCLHLSCGLREMLTESDAHDGSYCMCVCFFLFFVCMLSPSFVPLV